MNSHEGTIPDDFEILIVEDSPTQAIQLQYILEQNGWLISVAGNGREALEQLNRRRPALVISDIVMPEMDGYGLCKRIKADENLRDIPVFLLTQLSDPKDVLKALECDADNFIVKPYDEKYLLSQIQRTLTTDRLPREEETETKVEVDFGGDKYLVASSRKKILDLLLSTYETAVHKNLELIRTQFDLQTLNEQLEEKVQERTAALTAEIAERCRVEEALRATSEEVRNMSRQLWQSAKLATMGELAASIAHELNNPLATVSLRVESLLAEADCDEKRRKTLEIIDQEVERMGNLVANLLQFSRRSHPQITTVDVREEISGTLELIHYHLRNHRITVVREFDLHVPMVQADRQQLRQLFLNLFTNASDAMPQGGTLTIRVSGSDMVLIKISDTGAGIAPEDLEKVMEPFFTTKPESKGTGLGLPICRRIAKEHGGKLKISSEVGKGTTVRIALPWQSRVNGDFFREGA